MSISKIIYKDSAASGLGGVRSEKAVCLWGVMVCSYSDGTDLVEKA